jgi:hypothetical protein
MDCIDCIDYKNLSREQKELTAKYVLKQMKKNQMYDIQPCSVWCDRIKNIIRVKQNKFKVRVNWDFDRINTWRSLFDYLFKDLKLIVSKKIPTTQKLEYYIK